MSDDAASPGIQFGINLQKSELCSCVIQKKFLPLQSPNERGLSSVGLERLLDRQEVGSSNLPVLTNRKRHLQRCRCLFFLISVPKYTPFRQTAARGSWLYVPITGVAVRRGPKSACGAPQSPTQRAEPASRCGCLAAGMAKGTRGARRSSGATTGFPRGRRRGCWGSGGRGCGWRGPKRNPKPVRRLRARSWAGGGGGCG